MQLTLSSKDIDEQHIMHLNSNNMEEMAYDKAEEVIEELFESLLSLCQVGLETVGGSDIDFHSVRLLFHK